MNKFEIPGVCRCCLSQPVTLNDLFQYSDSMNIAEAIQDICGINIHPGSCFPDQICDDCVECLKASYNFRIRTQQSDKTLHGILEGSIIAKEISSSETEVTEVSNQTDSITTEIDSQSDEETNDNADEILSIPPDIDPAKLGLQCPHCQKDFVHLRNLRTHLRRHFTEGKYSCSHCPNRYHTKFDLHRHMTKIHSDGCVYKCDLCDKEFPTKPEWTRHISLHDEKKFFSCPKCGLMFKLKHNAQQHINSHESKKPFYCETCGKGFAFACKLKNHKKANCKLSVHISIQKGEKEL